MLKIDGGCHCGAITYEAEVDLATVGICHCTDCQQMSGSAFRTVAPAKKEHFKILKGQPKIYVKTAESGNKRAQAFCSECGTHLYATSPVDPQIFGIRTGTARQRAELKPQRQLWCRSAQSWLGELKGMKQFEKQA